MKKKLDQKIAINAKDIHAITVGVSVVMLTTLTEFFTNHFLNVETSTGKAEAVVYLALGITLTSRIIGVILRKVASNIDDKKPPRRRKRRITKK